jgi:hypothetical protein
MAWLAVKRALSNPRFTLCSAGAVQSSTWNSDFAGLALDRNYSSCSQTGLQIGAWWKYDLGRNTVIKGLDVTGNQLFNVI